MLENRLRELGLALPPAPQPLAAYIPASCSGNLVFVSGQLPMRNGELIMTGVLERDGQKVEEAQAAMRQCFLNALAAATSCAPLSTIKKVIRLAAFVASASGFTQQHLVANGASELAADLFGDAGKHARAAVGVSALPLNATVELEVIFEVSL